MPAVAAVYSVPLALVFATPVKYKAEAKGAPPTTAPVVLAVIDSKSEAPATCIGGALILRQETPSCSTAFLGLTNCYDRHSLKLSLYLNQYGIAQMGNTEYIIFMGDTKNKGRFVLWPPLL